MFSGSVCIMKQRSLLRFQLLMADVCRTIEYVGPRISDQAQHCSTVHAESRHVLPAFLTDEEYFCSNEIGMLRHV